MTILSGYRTAARNHAVGGATHSRHLYDDFPTTPAVDLKTRLWTPHQTYQYLAGLLGGTGGLGLYQGHVHVDLRSTPARWSSGSE